MRTDDVIGDLGEQLRTARPRRDPRPALALLGVAALAVAALALVPRDKERPARPAAPARARVQILNRTTTAGLARRTAVTLSSRGYRVLPISNAADQGQRLTTVTAVEPRFEPQARALRALLGVSAPAATGGSTAYAPLAPRAQVIVVLGADHEPPSAAGARALERALRPRSATCHPTPDGFGPLYGCGVDGRPYTVRVLAGCFDAKLLRGRGEELDGCGARP